MKLLLPIIIFSAFSVQAFSQNIAALLHAAPEKTIVQNIEAKVSLQADDNFPSGILFSGEEIKVSNIYPNPASSHATIDYDIMVPDTHAKVVIYNLLGNKVTEIPLEKEETNTKVSIDPLENGIYFYSLHVNGKQVAAKKMVVKK